MSDFNPIKTPKIYAYSDRNFPNCLKIGFTRQDDVMDRIRQQYPTKTPSIPYALEFETLALKDDGTIFIDHAIHQELRRMGIAHKGGEWYECDVQTLQNAIINVKRGKPHERQRTQNFAMRPEQSLAVDKAVRYFERVKADPNQSQTPHFLWNAKMRFGKTFASYQLARRMNWRKVLIVTFKPAVVGAWQDDLASHADFDGWQFITRDNELSYADCDKTRPIVCFGSFQDLLGTDRNGNIKAQNEWIHEINWDCVIFDEYHYGAWRERAKGLFAKDEANEQKAIDSEINLINDDDDYLKQFADFDEDLLGITTDHYLYLSGTPFRAIGSGEFIEEQIFNWTYSDEQSEKINWQGDDNPYLALPKMMLLTYQLPDSVSKIAQKGEFNEFDLNEFFKAEGTGDNARFKHETQVQKWLDLIRDDLDDTRILDLKAGKAKPPMPFSDVHLRSSLLHTLWFLPSVASCDAMANLLTQRSNRFYQEYQVVNASGARAGMGVKALEPVKNAMSDNPLATRTITLTCGKLTTGVSVPAWTGIFMLRNTASPETYFQSAFRVQTPWTARGERAVDDVIIKEECYIFDFAPNRALKQIADYSCQLNTNNGTSPERKVEEFIQFLPVLAYDGSAMKSIDAGELLDMAMSGTTATLLARRWQSALLVNVDNITLKNLMDNTDAMQALSRIEDFRSLNDDIAVVINKSSTVKELKKKGKEQALTKDEKQTLTDEEKKEKSLRKQIQDKLIKFATRIPIFMYLSDYREHTLQDVVRELEPELFTKVTGLSQLDFNLLVGLNVFNPSIMNDAVYKFKRYEDSSLEYAGIDKKDVWVGLYDTRIRRDISTS